MAEEDAEECLTTLIPPDLFDAVLARGSSERASASDAPGCRTRNFRVPLSTWSTLSTGLDLSAEAASCPLVQSDSPAAWLAHLEAPASCCCAAAAGGAPLAVVETAGASSVVGPVRVESGADISPAAAIVAARSVRAPRPTPTAACLRSLPGPAVAAMTAWLAAPENFESPYPTEEERRAFAEAGGITDLQVMYWFSNARRRVWKREYVAAGHDAPPPGRRKKARGSSA